MGLPVTATFYVAALASLIGVVLFWRMADSDGLTGLIAQ